MRFAWGCSQVDTCNSIRRQNCARQLSLSKRTGENTDLPADFLPQGFASRTSICAYRLKDLWLQWRCCIVVEVNHSFQFCPNPNAINKPQWFHLDNVFRNLYPGDRHIRPKIHQQLQELRDRGLLRLVERGVWQRT